MFTLYSLTKCLVAALQIPVGNAILHDIMGVLSLHKRLGLHVKRSVVELVVSLSSDDHPIVSHY